MEVVDVIPSYFTKSPTLLMVRTSSLRPQTSPPTGFTNASWLVQRSNRSRPTVDQSTVVQGILLTGAGKEVLFNV